MDNKEAWLEGILMSELYIELSVCGKEEVGSNYMPPLTYILVDTWSEREKKKKTQ